MDTPTELSDSDWVTTEKIIDGRRVIVRKPKVCLETGIPLFLLRKGLIASLVHSPLYEGRDEHAVQ